MRLAASQYRIHASGEGAVAVITATEPQQTQGVMYWSCWEPDVNTCVGTDTVATEGHSGQADGVQLTVQRGQSRSQHRSRHTIGEGAPVHITAHPMCASMSTSIMGTTGWSCPHHPTHTPSRVGSWFNIDPQLVGLKCESLMNYECGSSMFVHHKIVSRAFLPGTHQYNSIPADRSDRLCAYTHTAAHTEHAHTHTHTLLARPKHEPHIQPPSQAHQPTSTDGHSNTTSRHKTRNTT
jgi:hypothetical protein